LSLKKKKMKRKKKKNKILILFWFLASVAPNASPNIRYVVYFRLFAKDHRPGDYRKEALTSIWMDWKGLKEADIKAYSQPVLVTTQSKGLEQGLNSMNLGGTSPPVVDLTKYSRIAEEAEKVCCCCCRSPFCVP